ncbi:MAG TPA: hypothetical protein HA279_05085 [Candidatus Poseidoniaceae archaeon]|nr:hypothetical protein [Candidatus Poseidoniaceae archaeon]|tara:strand:+ start:191 stop:1168 length:978 start_codon:yes stop_codon:yes gene_type:complete
MGTRSKTLRFHIQLFVWRNRPARVKLQTIYDYLDSCCSWDADDIRPPNLRGEPTNEPSWKRNIRNVLKRDTDKGILKNDTRGEYSWNGRDEHPKWSFIIVEAIDNLGGETTNSNLYDEIERLGLRDFTTNWNMTVQGTIERHSSDSEAWGGNYDVFYSVQGMGHGIWGLRPQYRITNANAQVSSPHKSDIIDSETEDFVNKTIQAPNYALRTIAVRRGQPAFRAKLLDLYGSCMVTKCSDFQVLEACHIIPYSISNDNSAENGLLLRADIHTLFDLKLITINKQLTVRVSSELEDTIYRQLNGLRIRPAPQVNEEMFTINLRERT